MPLGDSPVSPLGPTGRKTRPQKQVAVIPCHHHQLLDAAFYAVPLALGPPPLLLVLVSVGGRHKVEAPQKCFALALAAAEPSLVLI